MNKWIFSIHYKIITNVQGIQHELITSCYLIYEIIIRFIIIKLFIKTFTKLRKCILNN